MFRYLNPNPEKRLIGDCVIRAIAIAQNRPWLDVYDDICYQGRLMFDMPSANEVWGEYLKMLGYIKKTCNDSSIIDFCYNHPIGIFIVGTGTHVVTIINGDYYDTWNSGDEIPIYYFAK